MATSLTVWVSCGILLSSLLLAVGAYRECTEKKELLLKEIPNTLTWPSDCLMNCTGQLYINKLRLQDHRNIRLADSTEEGGAYCWSMDIKCTTGESFHRAFVVLPVDTSVVGQEQLELRSTAPTAGTLNAHNGPTTLTRNCGLRYDVTQHFNTEQTGMSLCVEMVNQEEVLGHRVLRCPPFLVTFWQRSPNRSKKEGGG